MGWGGVCVGGGGEGGVREGVWGSQDCNSPPEWMGPEVNVCLEASRV